jgi:hypothetical protein
MGRRGCLTTTYPFDAATGVPEFGAAENFAA